MLRWILWPLNAFNCCLNRLWFKPLMINLFPQLTDTTSLKPVAKVREPRASPPAPIHLVLPAQVHTGEMMASRLTKLLTDAPWSLRVLPLPPDQLNPKTHLPVPRWTLEQRVHCSQSPHETAQSNATLILSGKCAILVISQGMLVFLTSRCVAPTDGHYHGT